MTDDGKSSFAHVTGMEGLRGMLASGRIRSLARIAGAAPDAEMSVEPLPVPVRRTMRAADALEAMRGIKDVDKVFMTRDGYLPNYGDAVVVKRLGSSARPHESWNTIPEEFATRRDVSLRRNADIYVPEDEVDGLRREFSGYRIHPKSELPLRPYGLSDRISAWPGKIGRRLGLVKEGGDGGLSARAIRRFGDGAMLVGSEALGIDLQDSSDTDVFVPYRRRGNFERAVRRMEERHPELRMNAASLGRDDKKTFSGRVNGRDVDVVLAWGPRAAKFDEAFRNAATRLTPERRKEIVDEKRRLRNAWFFPETRYKRFKRKVADELGLLDAYF